MSALAQATESQQTSHSVTKISANARIDYILRFSKQAVLVVDDQLEHCSTVASQFLTALPADHNAAFISISAKLNNIQVRCRLIEQLFNDELFDPEQSIAVSLVNLIKNKQQAVSIVIENAHLLSLQLIHELCQLAEIAKKADYTINVLMLGLPQAGITVANNRGLFHKKVSILSAQTGQLLSLNANLFKPHSSLFEFTPQKKLLWTIFSITLLLLTALVFVIQGNLAGFSKLLNSENLNSNVVTVKQKPTLKNTFVDNVKKGQAETIATSSIATSNEIYLAITNPQPVVVKTKVTIATKPKFALPLDILTAISAGTSSDVVTKPEEKQLEVTLLNIPTDTEMRIENSELRKTGNEGKVSEVEMVAVDTVDKPSTSEPKVLNNEQIRPLLLFDHVSQDYYLRHNEGFVIQIAAFGQKATFNEFIEQQPANQFYSYFRLFNNEKLLVVTSTVYPTKQLAQQALTRLSASLIARQPWIKSITAVNNEISGFQRSQ